jgi:hypothetical protein
VDVALRTVLLPSVPSLFPSGPHKDIETTT